MEGDLIMYSAVITKSGQVTLPKELREFLGLKLGGRVIFHKTKTGVNIERKMSDEEFLAELDAIGKPISLEILRKTADKTVSEMKDEWAKSPAGQAYYREKYGI